MSSSAQFLCFKRLYCCTDVDFKQIAPLSCTAAVTAVMSAWCHEKVWTLCNSIPSTADHQKWRDTEDKIMTRLLTLPLTPFAKQQLINFTHPIGMQLQSWFVMNNFLNLNDLDLPKVICWNCQGVIMLKETAEKIIKTGNVSAINCFILACVFCIEKDIFRLWPQVKDVILTNIPPQVKPEVIYWLYYLVGKIDEAMNVSLTANNQLGPYYFGLWLAMRNNNVIFADYFLEKMRSKKYMMIQMICNFAFRNESRGDIIPHFFWKLSISHQNLCLKQNSQAVLLAFLNWPFHSFFLDLASRIWEELEPKTYFFLLDRMCHLVWEFNQNPVYVDIIEGFWLRMCKPCCREYVIERCINDTFLHRLFSRDKMVYVISLIFQKSTISEKKDMFLSSNGMQTLSYLISQQRWRSVEQFLYNCLPLNQIGSLTEVFMNYLKVHNPVDLIREEDLVHFADILKSYKAGRNVVFREAS